MVRIIDLLFGRYEIRVDDKRLPDVTSFLLRKRISARIMGEGRIILTANGYEKIKGEYGDAITLEEGRFGIRSIPRFLRKRIASLVCLFACLLLFYLSSGLVWDVRISGNEELTDWQVREMLEECGLQAGDRWRRLDVGMIETMVTKKNDSIAWVNINRRGTVAYVEVVESKIYYNSTENKNTVGNIVAERDCVIEEITVKKGVANVKAGDVVRKGDVLISGITETESGTLICRAEGTVIGKSVGYVTGEAKRTESESVLCAERVAELRINFLKFNINIFKNYGNYTDKCDIIKEDRKFVTPFGTALPLGITRFYEYVFENKSVSYSDDDLIELAYKRHSLSLNDFSLGKELIWISTSADFTEDGYSVVSQIVYSSSVGVFSEIKMD